MSCCNPTSTSARRRSAQDDIVVEIHTDEGVSGIGESDVNPWIARACIEARGTHTMGVGLRELLLGADPLDVEGLWERLYVGTAMNGRRGAVINALGAIDMALHDLRGKALGKPCHELLGGASVDHITPYASLQPEVSGFDAYRDSLVRLGRTRARLGFRAIKAEVTLNGPVRPRRPERASRTHHRGGRSGARRRRAGDDAADRRAVRIPRRRHGAPRDSRLGRVRRLLRRDAALARRSRRTPPPRRGAADPDRERASG